MIFAEGFSGPEGPVVLQDKSLLIVEFAKERGCVTYISPDGESKRMIAKTGSPNGLAIDRDGSIWVAESKKPSLLKLTMDGKYHVFLSECQGEPFLLPNDLAFGPDGALYLTDSGFRPEDFYVNGKAREDYQNIPYDGRVYRIDTKTEDITKLDSGIRLTNGIAFGRGPDGMKFGEDGNLYVAVWGQGDVTVLGRDGSVVKRIKTGGMQPTNLAFGLPGEKKIYVTEMEFGTVEVYDVGTDGLPLHM
jgi:gluconolactonase